MGALIATLGRDRLATLLPHVSADKRAQLVNALGSGSSGAGLPPHIRTAMSQTFVYALSNALYVAGGLALVGAVLAWTLVGGRPAGGSPAEPERPAREPREQERPTELAAGAEPIHA
jgi:hypothetical protein